VKSSLVPVFSGSDTKMVAGRLSKFCKANKPLNTPIDKYIITLKIWTSLEKGILNSTTGDLQVNVPILNTTVLLPNETAIRNPDIMYREVTLDKIENEEFLSTILEEYR
jgi:hypothetical protein